MQGPVLVIDEPQEPTTWLDKIRKRVRKKNLTVNHTPGGHEHDQKKHGKRSGEKPVIFSAVYLDEKAKAELLDRVKPEHPNIIAHHMTIEFRPKSIDHLNLDEEVTLKIVGVAHDERGQAVLVESPIDSNNEHPHITISIAEGQVPKVSNEILETAPVDMFDEPFEIRGRVGVTREGEPTRTNSLTAQVPQILKDAGYKIDNPGGEWLEHEKKRAREKNVRGSVTALTQSLPVSVDELINLPGQNQEELRMDSDLSKKKIKELAASIKEKGLEHGPLVWVDVNGRATIAEGNHRIRAAKKLGMKTMPIQFRWFAGSETSNSLWGAKQVAERANKLTRNSCPVSRKVCPVANHKGPGPHPSGSSQDVHGKKGPVKSDEPEHHLAATWHLLSQKLTGITDRKLKSGKEAAPTVTEFAKYLQELHGKEIKTTTGKLSESDIEWISEALAEDILHSYAKADSGVGWYTKDVDEMWQKMSTEYPKLKDDENHKFIFTTAIALLSNGQDVDLNLRDAAALYERWMETGKITTKHKFSHQTKDVYKSLNVIQALLDSNLGVDGTRDLLNQKRTVKEIEQLGYDLLPDLTLPGKTPTSKLISPLLVDGELRNKEKVPVFSVFGPKIGSFYNNIKGDHSTLTMDRWFMRSFGRTTGELMTPGYLIEKRAQSIVDLIDGTFKDKESKTYKMADSELEGFSREELRSEFKRIAETGDFGFSDKGYQWAHNRERAYANSKSKTGKSFADKTKANLAANGMKKTLMEIHIGAPANGTHRRNIRQVMNRVLNKVEDRTGRKANIAEIQAVLWNHEKDLYRGAKVRSRKNINLSTAADMFINGDTERIVLTNAASFVYPNEMGNDSQALHDEWFSQIDVNQLVKELIARFS